MPSRVYVSDRWAARLRLHTQGAAQPPNHMLCFRRGPLSRIQNPRQGLSNFCQNNCSLLLWLLPGSYQLSHFRLLHPSLKQQPRACWEARSNKPHSARPRVSRDHRLPSSSAPREMVRVTQSCLTVHLLLNFKVLLKKKKFSGAIHFSIISQETDTLWSHKASRGDSDGFPGVMILKSFNALPQHGFQNALSERTVL